MAHFMLFFALPPGLVLCHDNTLPLAPGRLRFFCGYLYGTLSKALWDLDTLCHLVSFLRSLFLTARTVRTRRGSALRSGPGRSKQDLPVICCVVFNSPFSQRAGYKLESPSRPESRFTR